MGSMRLDQWVGSCWEPVPIGWFAALQGHHELTNLSRWPWEPNLVLWGNKSRLKNFGKL